MYYLYNTGNKIKEKLSLKDQAVNVYGGLGGEAPFVLDHENGRHESGQIRAECTTAPFVMTQQGQTQCTLLLIHSLSSVRGPLDIQGCSNMTGTHSDLFTQKSSQSYLNHLVHCEQRYLSRYSYWFRASRPGNRIPVRNKLSAPVQTGTGAHPASYKWA